MPKKIQALTNKCAGCGNELIFNPDVNALVCPACKSKVDIICKNSISKHDVDLLNDLSSNKNQTWINQQKEMECPNCGAHTMLNGSQISAKCPYCSSSLIASKDNNFGLKPDGIIPFKISKQKAENIFKENLKNKFLVPKEFKENIKADSIIGYYFPAFIFNAECISSYDGRLYTTFEVEDKNGFKETKKTYFNINGQKVTHHSNIEIEASEKITQYELRAIKPYNFQEACSYTDEYAYGFGLECNSNSIANASEQAKKVIENEIRNAVLFNQKYNGIDYLDVQTSYIKFKYSYIMLPAYRINFKYKDKQYSNIMNGQTGLLTGSHPTSSGKIALITFLISLVVILPILLIVLLVLGFI